MLDIRDGSLKMLAGKTLIRLFLQKQSDLGLHCLSVHFWQETSVRNFSKFTII